MKIKLFFFLAAFFLVASLSLQAQQIRQHDARKIAGYFIALRTTSALQADAVYEISEGNSILGWIYQLEPTGFVIIAGDKHLPAVFAWSEENDFDVNDPHGAAVLKFVRSDMKLRLLAWDKYSDAVKSRISNSWSAFEKGGGIGKFQQWPPVGSTATEGWVETNWTQSNPYNMYCPMDLGAGSRSVAGCPAVAMAQILNYLRLTNGTRFDNSDDYYHAYAGNNFYIDNDSATYDFPGFGTLNYYLDSLDFYYSAKANLSNSMKAALVFASGTACAQVYNAGGSGTFGINQAADAYQRFGFTDSRLVFDTDTSLNTDLANNIKAGLCAHLGIVDSAGTVGHNVVVDGYNTDEFYHFNFGWGGSWNGWFTMPPTSMPYSLTVIEGIVLDIFGDSIPSGIATSASKSQFSFYPNPADSKVTVSFDKTYDSIAITIFDGSGQLTFQNTYLHTDQILIDMTDWRMGAYIVTFTAEPGLSGGLKIIKQ